MKERITLFLVLILYFNVSAIGPISSSSDITFPKEIGERPVTVIQYADEDLLELSVVGHDVKNILILNSKGAIVGNIENISPRMAIDTGSWPSGNYTMLYTVENTSFREVIIIE